MPKKKTKEEILKSKLYGIVYKIENYSIKINPNEVNYDWLAEKRGEVINTIFSIFDQI